MKAKEYVKQYEESLDKKEAMNTIAFDFIFEIRELIKARKAGSNESCFAIFKEQDLKFQSFARTVNEKKIGDFILDPNSFLKIMEQYLPEEHALYTAHLASK